MASVEDEVLWYLVLEVSEVPMRMQVQTLDQ
jgi:hypothetical protein